MVVLKSGKRSYYVDWLRVLTMLAVYYFHNARVFDLEFWYIKSDQPSFGLTLFVLFTHQWIMPLFFLLAGAGSRFSLAVRGAGTYITERFRRLVIPYIAGLFLLAPPQSYLQHLSRLEFQGSFAEYYPYFLQGLRPIPSPWLL